MNEPKTAAQEWRESWTVVVAAFVGFSFLTIMSGSLTMFMQPLADEFGWSRTLISSGFTVSNVFTAILSPIFGAVIDRYGARKVALPGIILTVISICSFALADGSATQWYALWAIYAIISIGVKTTVWTAAVASLFRAGQGLALGITLCGMAASQTFLPPIANWLIDDFGWRMAYVWLGLGWGGLTFILVLFFFYDAYDRSRARGEVAPARQGNARTRTDHLPGLTMREAWRDRALWHITFSTLIIMTVTLGLTIHQVPILNGIGLSRTHAALLASLAGIASLLGKIVTGALLDRYRPNWVGGVTLATTAFAFVLLIDGVHSLPLIIFAMVVNGYTQGTKLQICTYLTARYAGMRNFGSIFGFMNSVMAVGSGTGPVFAALSYDSGGSYTVFLVAGAIGCVVSGILLLTLPGFPDWDAVEPEQAAR